MAGQTTIAASDVIAGMALLVAIGAAIFTFLSLRTSRIQAQAAIFPERFKVFSMVKEFLRPWFRDGRPDLRELPTLIDAWERSKFLFEPSVTKFLRQMWKDAVNANHSARIVAGEIAGDRDNAIEREYTLGKKYLAGNADEPDLLVEAFKSMKIEQ